MAEMITEQDQIESQSGASIAPLDSLTKEMIDAGVWCGHKKSRTNPRFRPFIHSTRNGMEIIDVAKTADAIKSAAEFLRVILKKKGMVLVVATQPAAVSPGRAFAESVSGAFINDKWIGGLLTNFKELSGRIEYFKKLKEDLASGALEKYTKKERVEIAGMLEKMERRFSGITKMTALPSALLIVDTVIKGHVTALREAKKIGIPVVGVIDSDDDPEPLAVAIPGNDHALQSITWILEALRKEIGDIATETPTDKANNA